MKQSSNNAIWLLPVLTIAMLAAGQVWLSHLRYETSQASQQLREEKKTVSADVTQLGLEVASLTRPERLRRMANSKLGMQPPHPMQVVRP